MALGDAYATAAELEARTGRTDDGTFDALLDAASRRVEDFCRRQFNKVTVASERRFLAVDPTRLPVDDFHTTTDLAVDVGGQAWDVADVDPRPWNGTVNGMAGWPYFDLFAVNRTWPWRRRPTITVTAQWGWDAVPEAIRQATLDVASVMVFGGSSGGPVKSEAIDGYSVSYSVPALGSEGSVSAPAELVKAVPYRRVRFGVA
jgi:hypothetical protein